MHELSVCQSLLKEVERISAAHSHRRASEIVVAVGPLSGVEPALLARAFTIARNGTVAEDARLDTEISPVTVWCEPCQKSTVTPPNALLCGTCGSWQVSLRSGDELLLKRVVLVDETAAAAAS